MKCFKQLIVYFTRLKIRVEIAFAQTIDDLCGLLGFTLIGDRVCFSGYLFRVSQVVMLYWLHIVIEFIDQWHARWNVQLKNVFFTDPVEMFYQGA